MRPTLSSLMEKGRSRSTHDFYLKKFHPISKPRLRHPPL